MSEPHVPQPIQDALDRLAAKVSSNTTVDGSAIDLIGGLRAEIRDLRDQIANLPAPVDVAAVVAKLDEFEAGLAASEANLAAAVQENT